MGIYLASYSFTRPADTTTYAANDLVANSTTAGSVVPIKLPVGRGGCSILGIYLLKSDETDVANADFDINLYSSEPTTTAGDNAAWSVASSPVAGYIGEWDLPTMVAGSDDAWTGLRVGDTGFLSPIYVYTTTGYIYGLLQADSAYGPASGEVFTCNIVYEKDRIK